MKSVSVLMVFGMFLSAGNLFAQSQDEVIAAWIKEGKAKLSADIQKVLTPGFKFDPAPHYENWLKDPPLAKLHQLGIPRKSKEGKPPAPLENAYRFSLEGFHFVIADYQGDISSLYIKKKGAGYKQLFHLPACSKIRLLKPGEKAPIFIVVAQSGCASGWGESLYLMEKKGKLKEVGHLGGWQGGSRYVDIDLDGVMEVINISSTSRYPKDLEERLKKLKDYQEHEAGPVLSENKVYKWNGEEFSRIAEFYERVEW